MKISSETISILKNFSQINPNILIKEGNIISTKNEFGSVYARAGIKEYFPMDFAIYDLNEFLSVVSIAEDPDFSFSENYVDIIWGNNKIRYNSADIVVITYPKGNFKAPPAEVNFLLNKDIIDNIITSAKVFKQEHIAFVSDATNNALIQSYDKKGAIKNFYEFDLGYVDDNVFNMIMDISLFKPIMGDYMVSISSKNLVMFENKNTDITYCISTDVDSKFGS